MAKKADTVVSVFHLHEVAAKNHLESGDILIDEENLNTIANECAELANDVRALRKEIEQMLEDLKTGFDTPAGRKFYKSCADGLLTPLEQQAIVMDHIAENMVNVRNMYKPVFDEYREIVSTINSQ